MLLVADPDRLGRPPLWSPGEDEQGVRPDGDERGPAGADACVRPGESRGANEDVDELVRRAVVDVLTGKQREAVEMHFFEGLSEGAIARRLGVTQQVVHKRLFGDVRRGRVVGGAIARLRMALAPQGS